MSEKSPRSCRYVRHDGTSCPGQAEGEGEFCYWHDPDVRKEGPDVKQRLEAWARSGQSMEGFVLRSAHLKGVRLHDQCGLDLSHADLSRASLQGASMFNIDLRGAQLMKADLSGANLNHAKLQDADLLGAVLEGTKLERVTWDDQSVQEREAFKAQAEGRTEKARVLFEEAEEVYRNVRRAYDRAGRSDETGRFFYREMVMRRMLMPKWSIGRCWSAWFDLVCGYGESPQRVFGFSLMVILGFALLYLLMGVNSPGGFLAFSPSAGFSANFCAYWNCVYYSVITFTTTGYGDFTPAGYTKIVAGIEAFAGGFNMALFIVVFCRKMMRS